MTNTSTSAKNGHFISRKKKKKIKEQRNHLQLVDAPPSSGKTHQMCNFITSNIMGSGAKRYNHMIVQPTDVVMKETANLVQVMGHQPILIDTDSLNEYVHVKAIASALLDMGLMRSTVKKLIKTRKPTLVIDAYLKAASKFGHVLIITHAAYLRLPYFHKVDNWKIYFDECVQIDHYHEFDVSRNVGVIKDRVIMGTVNPSSGMAPLFSVNESKLKDEISNPDDVLTSVEGLLKFLRDILDPNQEMFVEPDVWDSLGDSGNWLNAISMLKPSKFKGVTLLSANIGISMMHFWFTHYHGIETMAHSMTSKLRYHDLYHLKDRVRVHYLTRGWYTGYGSKNLCNQYQAAIDQKALDFIGGRDFIYAANNFYGGVLGNDNRIPVISHGLNEYDNETIYFHNVTQNRNSNHIKLLTNLGFNEEFVTIATVVEGAFQSAMRTNLRKNSAEVVDIIVIGDALARGIASRFGLGADEVNYIGGDELDFTSKLPIKSKCTPPLNSIAGKVHFDDRPRQGSTLCVGFNASGDFFNQNIESFDSHLELIGLFRDLSKDIVVNKDDALMFNPSIFTDEGATAGRGLRSHKQMLQANLVVIDIDGGTVCKDECAKQFWSEAGYGKKHSFIICNSFRNSPEMPNRYRLIFPLKSPIYSIDHYKQVVTSLAERIPDGALIDKNSWTPVQDYFCPCTNAKYQDNEEYTFFEAIGCKTREYQRCALDPCSDQYKYVESTMKNVVDFPSMYRERKVTPNAAKVQQHIGEYHGIPAGAGMRRAGLNKLALQLSNHMDQYQMESTLCHVVGGEEKMLRRIPEVVNSACEYIAA